MKNLDLKLGFVIIPPVLLKTCCAGFFDQHGKYAFKLKYKVNWLLMWHLYYDTMQCKNVQNAAELSVSFLLTWEGKLYTTNCMRLREIIIFQLIQDNHGKKHWLVNRLLIFYTFSKTIYPALFKFSFIFQHNNWYRLFTVQEGPLTLKIKEGRFKLLF